MGHSIRTENVEPLVLIVDDMEVGREVIAAPLRRESIRLATASSGEEALHKAARLHPDVILLDVMMPGMDGFEVCRRLREDEDLAEIPILLVTALDDRESRLHGLSVGADDFISRPFDLVELTARVRTICRLNRYRKIVEERFKVGQLFELAAHGIAVVDQQLRILAANPSMRSLLRLKPLDGLIGRSILDWIAPSHLEDTRGLMLSALDPPVSVTHHDTVIRQGHGNDRLIDLAIGPCPWNGTAALQVFFRDVTERRRAAEVAERLQRSQAVANSASEIVHGFNNCLSVISLNAELLESADPSVAAILEACGDAAALSDRILAFARPREPSGAVGRKIDQVLAEMLPTLSSILGSRLGLRLEGQAGGARCMVDADHLKDVILILVLNARDAMDGGGEVVLRTERNGPDSLQLHVQDSGVGMDADLLERAFEPFFTTKREDGGLGLGLSTALTLVEAWGGSLGAHSAVGRGSTFSVAIPVAPDSWEP